MVSLTRIAKLMSNSGLKVNEAKTDFCGFYKNDTAEITLTLNGVNLKSPTTMNATALSAFIECKTGP